MTLQTLAFDMAALIAELLQESETVAFGEVSGWRFPLRKRDFI